MTFLQDSHYAPAATRPVGSSDGFLLAHGVPSGTLVINGHIDESSRRGLFETGDITIFIVLDANRRVERAYVFEQFLGP